MYAHKSQSDQKYDRGALICGGITVNKNQRYEYVRFFNEVGATDYDLYRLVVKANGRFLLMSDYCLRVYVHEDTWQIVHSGGELYLYHNNYHFDGSGARVFEDSFHPQNDHGIHTFSHFTKIIVNYSFSYHVRAREKRAHKIFCAKLKAELAIVNNCERETRLSLFYRYYSFADYYDGGEKVRAERNRAIRVISAEPCGGYAIVRCRVRKRDHDAFEAYMRYLKTRAFRECRADYVTVCEERFRQVV